MIDFITGTIQPIHVLLSVLILLITGGIGLIKLGRMIESNAREQVLTRERTKSAIEEQNRTISQNYNELYQLLSRHTDSFDEFHDGLRVTLTDHEKRLMRLEVMNDIPVSINDSSLDPGSDN